MPEKTDLSAPQPLRRSRASARFVPSLPCIVILGSWRKVKPRTFNTRLLYLTKQWSKAQKRHRSAVKAAQPLTTPPEHSLPSFERQAYATRTCQNRAPTQSVNTPRLIKNTQLFVAEQTLGYKTFRPLHKSMIRPVLPSTPPSFSNATQRSCRATLTILFLLKKGKPAGLAGTQVRGRSETAACLS